MNTIEKIINARKNKVTVGKMTFHFLRPSDYQMAKFSGEASMEKLARYVIGWEGVNEIDLIGSGDPEPATFSAELLQLWGEENMDVLTQILQAINESYAMFVKNRDESLGKPETGLSVKTSP